MSPLRLPALLLILVAALLVALAAGCPPSAKPAETPKTPAAGGETTTTGEPAGTLAGGEMTEDDGTMIAEGEEGTTTTLPDGTTVAADGTTVDADGLVTTTPPAPDGLTRETVEIQDKVGIMATSQGDIYFFFYPEDAENHVRNFIYLAQKDFYRDIPFHRVIPEFVIQGGEQRKDWTEPLPALKLEANTKRIHIPGALSAARTADLNSATSQFYFVLTRDRAQHLDTQYTVYGQAFRGMEVIEKIGTNASNHDDAQSPQYNPADNDLIKGVRIVDAAEYAAEIEAYKAQHNIP